MTDKEIIIAELNRLKLLNLEYKKSWRWKFKWFSRTIIGRLEVIEGMLNFIKTL